MARVTKTQAEDVANKLVEKIQKEINVLETQIEDIAIAAYETTIPAEVKKVWEKHPNYVKASTSVKMIGTGIVNKYRSTALRKKYPSTDGYGNYVELQLNTQQANAVVKLMNKQETLKEKKKITKETLQSTLLSLTTWKKVLAEFPELQSYAPKEEKTGLMHIPKTIRETVKCLVQPDKPVSRN